MVERGRGRWREVEVERERVQREVKRGGGEVAEGGAPGRYEDIDA